MGKKIMILAAAMLIAGVYLFLTYTAGTSDVPAVRFTSLSFAQEPAGSSAGKTDLTKCIITLAYSEFIVDGNYHTPKVTIIFQGRRLRKNVDYKLSFIGGKDAGKSTVTITGIGTCTGKVTKTYTGIPPAKATTKVKKTAAKAVKPTTSTAPATTIATKAAAKAKAAKTTTAAKTAAAAKKTTKAEAAKQTIRSISAYTFPDTGRSMGVGAKASSGLRLKYKSSNPGIVVINEKGVMKSKKPGTAKIIITQKGNSSFKPASKTLKVVVPSFRSREAALKPWRHILIDTFFHINGRKYSHGDPGKYWKNSSGKWSGKTGKKGNTQSCVTLSTVSLKRMELLPPKSGCIWLSSNHGKKPNKTVRRLRGKSKTLSISYPHKSLKYLAQRDLVRYGDILCRSGHTFVYMGKDAGGTPLIYESGTRRDIGNGTCVRWGHHAGGHADKLTGKINKQIQQSDAVGDKWKHGKISDDAFRGHRASGKNLNSPIHVVCSIRTFKVRTSCINGTITPGNIYMAGENAVIKYASPSGKPVEYVKVDGRKVKVKTKYTIKRITADHSVEVKYRE